MQRERIDIQSLTQRIVEKYQDSMSEKKINCTVSSFEGKAMVLADERKIEVVLENVLLNAVHYTERGGSINVLIREARKGLEVCIEDTGIGIPVTHQKRIFEKFFRADNALEHNAEGSGLGLYLSKKIMRQLRGDIWFEARSEGGTRFCILIPS